MVPLQNRNVNPYLDKGQSILKRIYSTLKKKHSLFLDIALPYLHNISRELKESEMMALLIDADGYVLSLAGCRRTLEEAKNQFVEGVRWTETEVGTNAIGTALEIGEAVTIHGTEHFRSLPTIGAVLLHRFAMKTAPLWV
ncbi:hypothetical protein PO124_17020 [Bacillus licheniformis]|nr:hypothetical protein [Bacillus licheniformis]